MGVTNEFILHVMILGAAILCVLLALQMKWYRIKVWKCVPVTISLLLTALWGSQLWFFVENGEFGGRSMYGALFLIPVVFFPVSKLLRIPYGEMMDLVAPAGCSLLGLAKLQCLRDGCCGGKFLYINEDRIYVHFPSQIVEFSVAVAIAITALLLSRIPKLRKSIFPWAIISYGTTRFVLNFFRKTEGPFALGLSAGSFWSVCAVLIGTAWLIFICCKNHGKNPKIKTIPSGEAGKNL